MRKLITAILIFTAVFSVLRPETGLKFSDISSVILAQNYSEDTSAETQGITPRIKSKKKAEYSENKSPMIAAGLSLLVPGAGEYYGRDYLRSAIFFGIEAALLSGWYYYESDGDDKRDEYRSYADRYFDEDIYYGGLLGMTQNYKSYMETLSWIDASEYWSYKYFKDRDNWTTDNNDSLAVYDLLTLSFKDPFNGLVVSQTGGSAQFTHNLPETKTQQYYEMIGKYHQFACGWSDFDGYEYDDNGDVVMENKTVYSNKLDSMITVSIPKFKSGIFDYSENGYKSARVNIYEDLRDKTNQAYETGQNFLMIALVNHVASAFDASYVIKKKYQIDSQLRIENSDKADRMGLDNYKVTYSLRW